MKDIVTCRNSTDFRWERDNGQPWIAYTTGNTRSTIIILDNEHDTIIKVIIMTSVKKIKVQIGNGRGKKWRYFGGTIQLWIDWGHLKV